MKLVRLADGDQGPLDVATFFSATARAVRRSAMEPGRAGIEGNPCYPYHAENATKSFVWARLVLSARRRRRYAASASSVRSGRATFTGVGRVLAGAGRRARLLVFFVAFGMESREKGLLLDSQISKRFGRL